MILDSRGRELTRRKQYGFVRSAADEYALAETPARVITDQPLEYAIGFSIEPAADEDEGTEDDRTEPYQRVRAAH